MAKCCSKCFNDKIISSIIEKESELQGTCDFCNSENVKLINPSDFESYFETLLELYSESEELSSKPLYELVQNDWNMFSSISIAELLIPKILTYVDLKKYVYSEIDNNTVEDWWEKFCSEIKHSNRFFHKSDVKIDSLKEWVSYLANDDYSKKLFRARISEDKKKIVKNKMGKPPIEKATAGRANPVGIAYLYCATDSETAIAEIRPHKSDFVSVAQLEIQIGLKLKIADLRNPRKNLSPFMFEGYSVQDIYKYITLMQKLGEELSKPILPREAHLEYVPSQYLSELIKDSGFDGILYKSSVGNGDNIALFSDENIVLKNVKLYEVKNLIFESNKIQ